MICLQRSTTFSNALLYCPPQIDNCTKYKLAGKIICEKNIDCSAHPIRHLEYIVSEGTAFGVYYFDWNSFKYGQYSSMSFLGRFKRREVAQLVYDNAESNPNLRSVDECKKLLQSLSQTHESNA